MTSVMAPLPGGAPTQLGGYRLLGVLGSGGMGTVYLARGGRARRVALKTVRPELLRDQGLRDRFAREVAAAAAVRSPFVAAVLDSAPRAGVPWLASEFVPGPTLGQAVRRHGPLPVPAVCALAGALGRALTALAAAGVVHRDLKPSNLILAADRPRLVDFGIARVAGDATLTRAEQRPGTPGYMSPEQVLKGKLGPASDVFCAGALLAFAVTGRHTFLDDDQAGADVRIVYGEPDLDEVPGTLLPVVRDCLAKRPGDRPTAAELAAALDPHGAAERAAARWLPPEVRADIAERERAAVALGAGPGLPARRRVLLGAGGALLLAAGAGVLTWPRAGSGGAEHGPAPRWTGAPGVVPRPLWAYDRAAAKPLFAPVDADGVVCFADADGHVVGHDPVSGERRWRGPVARALLGGGRPVALGADGAALFLDPGSGTVRERVAADAERLLAADEDTAYVLDRDRRIRALGSADGRQRWVRPMPVSGPVGAAAGRGLLVLASGTSAVTALSAADGGQAWRHPAPGVASSGAGSTGGRRGPAKPYRPAFSTRGVVLGAGRTLIGLDPADGVRMWSLPADEKQGFGEPTVVGDAVFVADGGQLRAVDAAAGRARWTVVAGDTLAGRPGPLPTATGVHAALANPELGTIAVHTGRAAEQYLYAPAGLLGDRWQGVVARGSVVWQRGSDVSALPGL
ncbi:protein kinase domain-containing protein [Streptomyces sp. SAJ15]|uniref:serine/threonine-protein kinase n=1 Tax=Streptomyces sp. SAJ15 TaxID=2011095 RepID=UPI001185462C|nr:serine/threonine-protein kinase [Streptomyces sp. SAJ15]TVL91077.1 serine/threonine protein kinase [Streptomyces sp. SAJ15]